MFHQELRTHTAEELGNLLTSPHAQEHLRRYGWQPAMPIVITAPYETLDCRDGTGIHLQLGGPYRML